mmetsp:Transcript_14069/g.32578  ORF Transcript_14069/g.32578 Transcript_14069/m.32578 type:complete len:317 (+) Transcript_14069:12-962(+)
MPRKARGAGVVISLVEDPVADQKLDADAKLSALVEELDVEVESRCKLLQSQAEYLAKVLKSDFNVMLAKLPKKAREMTVAEFFAQNAAYVADLKSPDMLALAAELAASAPDAAGKEAKEEEDLPARTPFKVVQNEKGVATVMRSTRAASKFSSVTSAVKRKPEESEEVQAPRTTRRMTKTAPVLATPSGKGSASSAVMQTPMLRADLPCTPAGAQFGGPLGGLSTSLRLPKRGESIFSSRGSPGKVMQTDAAAQMILDGDYKIAALAMGTGCGDETVNLANPDEVVGMSKSSKIKAAENVLMMQKQLEAMLEALKA